MKHESAQAGLNDNHRRRVYATCTHLDKLLTGIEAVVRASSPDDGGPLFRRYEQTLAPEVRAEALAWVGEFREIIRSALARHRIGLPAPSEDQRFAVSSALGFIDLDIEELRPEHMTGYGTLDSRAAADLEAIVAAFREHVRTLATRLQEHPKK